MIGNYPLFRAEVKKQMDLRGWKHKDLAIATGYSIYSINSAFSGARCSDKLMKAIADALNISMYLAN